MEMGDPRLSSVSAEPRGESGQDKLHCLQIF